MAFVQYVGTSHFRILDAEDLKKFGVNGFRKTTWAQGETLEVDNSVAQALMDNLDDEFDLVDEAKPAALATPKTNWVERTQQGQTEEPAPSA